MQSIPQGTRIFIDSNIFIYHFLGQSESCRSLLEMAEDLEIRAYASAVVLAEVLHKLMLTEAAEKFGIKPHDVVCFLKRRPELIPELKKCEAAVGEIPDYNIEILPIEKEAIFESAELRKKHSLLTNDSLNLYAMKTNKLRYIATNDSDFDRVEWITVWKPELIDYR